MVREEKPLLKAEIQLVYLLSRPLSDMPGFGFIWEMREFGSGLGEDRHFTDTQVHCIRLFSPVSECSVDHICFLTVKKFGGELKRQQRHIPSQLPYSGIDFPFFKEFDTPREAVAPTQEPARRTHAAPTCGRPAD